jgi:hypothetical protein
MFELDGTPTDQTVRLHFGPTAPQATDAHAADRLWIKTLPGTGWFVYFRIYGPDQPAFDGTWQLPDFTKH